MKKLIIILGLILLAPLFFLILNAEWLRKQILQSFSEQQHAQPVLRIQLHIIPKVNIRFFSW